MKRWIHASEDIEYKTRAYIAAWAKDDAKSEQPVATYREFCEEMKDKELKCDGDDYDYYITCYNSASKK